MIKFNFLNTEQNNLFYPDLPNGFFLSDGVGSFCAERLYYKLNKKLVVRIDSTSGTIYPIDSPLWTQETSIWRNVRAIDPEVIINIPSE